MTDWMIYGATGYTGRLIAREAAARGLNPILAGRGAGVQTLANELGLRWKVFGLGNADSVSQALSDVKLVLHCAGPFVHTFRPMVDACLAVGAHYLDISGEISTLEHVLFLHDAFQEREVLAIPGVGFDVVPTDCVARRLSQKMPDAYALRLAFKMSANRLSGGTYQSMFESLGQGSLIRREGLLLKVGLASETRLMRFEAPTPELVMQVPWGDVATAYHSTGIPNVETFAAARPAEVYGLRALGTIARVPFVRQMLRALAGSLVNGPSQEMRESGRCWVTGEVTNRAGETRVLRLRTPEGYRFTVLSALAAVQRVRENRTLAGADGPVRGALTPSVAFGANFVFEIPDVVLLGEETLRLEPGLLGSNRGSSRGTEATVRVEVQSKGLENKPAIQPRRQSPSPSQRRP